MVRSLSAKGVLESLLRRGEVASERVRDITLPASRIAGYPIRDAQAAAEFHETLKYAEKRGAIAVEWVRGYIGHELARVRLRDAPALARFLGRPFLPEQVDQAFEALDLGGLPQWLQGALSQLRESWLRGASRYALRVEDAGKLPLLIKAVRAIEALEPEGALDFRQFGARYLGDSKALRFLEAPLVALYRPRVGVELESREVLAQLNLVPLSQPVLLRGPLTVFDGEHRVDARVQPYVGVPGALLQSCALTAGPEYILTIENQSSFNEYTATFRDEGVVIYTAGFPVRALQAFYRRLTATSQAPVYHWGDTDVGGFRILKCLQQASAGITVHPHLMGLDEGEAFSTKQMDDLKRLLPINPAVDPLVLDMLERGTGRLEQEQIVARRVPVARPL
ncbi:Wadjet anti-phage system protein JetD domain-containing protein [Thioalkalivibrio thiocyanodenitrificans]|uniref:Wadjet anti-phage system protein JetD domain-containing protein n=1 Tax=Thioalkalivibrio thiocyanodenitrificans TaxID=243063 RepID=UPI00035D11AC|nr:Wadjet anti-phage system protein JetD domain-containing protein [Thioalkalivibrio thiocyanodenitrificans]